MEKIDILVDNLSDSTNSEIKQYAQDVFGIVPQDFGEDADEIYTHIVDEILPMADDEEIDEYFETYFGAYADEVLAQYNDEPNDLPPNDKSLNERFKKLAGIKPLYSNGS